jgi:hypothetical protein
MRAVRTSLLRSLRSVLEDRRECAIVWTIREKLLKIVRTLETDYEPYGKVERDNSDCSCGCRHFVKLAGDVGEEWGTLPRRRPFAAHPRHLRPSRQDPRGPASGRTRPARIPAAPPRRTRSRHVAAWRRHRYRGPGETQLETDREISTFASSTSRPSSTSSAASAISSGSVARRSRSPWSPSSATPTPARALSSMFSPRPACSNRPACSRLSTPNSGNCSFLTSCYQSSIGSCHCAVGLSGAKD